jgi:hypothetical protein
MRNRNGWLGFQILEQKKQAIALSRSPTEASDDSACKPWSMMLLQLVKFELCRLASDDSACKPWSAMLQ